MAEKQAQIDKMQRDAELDEMRARKAARFEKAKAKAMASANKPPVVKIATK